MNSGIFTLNSYVMKTVLQILTCFNLHSKEIDVNTSAELELNRRRSRVKHSQLKFWYWLCFVPEIYAETSPKCLPECTHLLVITSEKIWTTNNTAINKTNKTQIRGM